jgi:DNA-binding CsgD family transcriptional regulator
MNELLNTPLSERELEILRLVAQGKANKEIAAELFISVNTVKVHLAKIFHRIGVASRTEATLYAIEHEHVENPNHSLVNPQDQQVESRVELVVPETVIVERAIVKLSPGEIIRKFWWAFGLGLLVLTSFTVAWDRGWIFPKPTPDPILAAMNEDRWKELAPMSVARANMAVTVYDNKIYVIGGETEEGVTGLTEVYDIATDTWARLPDKPTPVTNAKAVVVGGKIYVPGGRDVDDQISDVLEIFDPQKNWWKSTKLDISISDTYAMFSNENNLYLLTSELVVGNFEVTLRSTATPNISWEKHFVLKVLGGDGYAIRTGNSFTLLGFRGENGPVAISFNPESPKNYTFNNDYSLVQETCKNCAYLNMSEFILGIGYQEIRLFDTINKSVSENLWQKDMPKVSGASMVVFQNKLYELGGKEVEGKMSNGLFSVKVMYTISIPIITTGQ